MTLHLKKRGMDEWNSLLQIKGHFKSVNNIKKEGGGKLVAPPPPYSQDEPDYIITYVDSKLL